MANAPFSSVLFNYREEILASDLFRSEQLGSRELQDVIRNGSRGLDLPAINAAVPPFSNVGSPIVGCSLLPTIVANTGTPTMVLGAGQAYYDDPAITGDFSPYTVCRWVAQTLTFTPDATNPRIALVYVIPATADTDLASRNILVDPTLRTVTSTAVYKTRNPSSAVAVIHGTAGGSPSPPAVPAGSIALFELYIPAASGTGNNSATYGVVRRLNRLMSFPYNGSNAIVQGCRVAWTDVNPATTDSTPSFMAGQRNRLIIDGEMLEFDNGTAWCSGPDFISDTTLPPVGGSGTSCAAFYLYAVGGRRLPQASGTGTCPIIVVMHASAPFEDGTCSGAITIPRGTIAAGQPGAICIGVGWRHYAGTKSRVPVKQVGDVFYATAVVTYKESAVLVANTEQYYVDTAKPANAESLYMRGLIGITSAAGDEVFSVGVGTLGGTNLFFGYGQGALPVGSALIVLPAIEVPVAPSTHNAYICTSSGTPTTLATVETVGYRIRLPRLGA